MIVERYVVDSSVHQCRRCHGYHMEGWPITAILIMVAMSTMPLYCVTNCIEQRWIYPSLLSRRHCAPSHNIND